LEKRLNSLAEQLKKGDPQAASELVDRYYEGIYLYMRRLGHNQQTSEDLTQESFMRAWQHTEQLRNNSALNSWLYRIAGNASRQYWRKHKGKNAVSIEGFEIPHGQDSEDEKLALQEQLSRLSSAVAKLPLRLRDVVVLHYMQHLSIAEAAEAAGVRKGTFKSRLNRALKTLRKEFG